ncbi:diguanylate cyclase [Mycobacterium sp. ENV421]|uniref:diguanylate cyclase domain-containing protein n=1 Tax=Mycobacterium sp. ENV421 TaxID=1213407 RepID=UPI001304FB8E|nr:diguanylate cyclase [Mycobacterium sp. ENV421]
MTPEAGGENLDSRVVVRLGGDEFVVVRERLPGLAQLDDLAEHIGHSLSTSFDVDSHALTVGASIGRAAGSDLTAAQLLSRADEAMYRIKRDRRGEGGGAQA